MKSKVATRCVVVGLLLQISVVVALLFAVSGLLSTFDAIGAAGDRSGAAQAISQHLIRVKSATSVGVIVGLVGLSFLAIGIGRGARQRWVLRSSIVAMIAWLPLFPVGSLIGATGLVFFVTQREKFGRAEVPNQSPEPTVMSVTPPAAQEPRQP